MKTLRFWQIPVLGFLIGVALGVFSGGSPRSNTIAENSSIPASAPPASTPRPISAQAAVTAPAHEEWHAPLTHAFSHASDLHRLHAFASFLDTLGPGQYAAVWAELKVLRLQQRFDARRLFFARWTALAPGTALEHALQEERESRDVGVISDLLVVWAQTDPEIAWARIDQLPEALRASVRLRLNQAIPPKVATTAPRETLQEMLRNQKAPDPDTVSRIFMEWAKTEPEAAAREALNLPRTGPWAPARERGLSTLISAWARQDPRGAAAWIDAQPEKERAPFRRQYLGALLDAEKPDLAITYASGLPDGGERRKLLGQLADQLADRDREKAVAFVESLPAGDLQDLSVFVGFFQRWIKAEPGRAAEVLRKHLPDMTHMPQSVQWIRAFEFERMLSPWIKQDPAAAGRFVVQLPEQAREAALWSVARELCERDAEGAGQWAAALPAGPAREAALRRVAQVWAGHDASQVTQWLDRLPAGPGKSAAADGFATAVFETSPNEALAWLRIVPDEPARLERLRRVWRAWSDKDAPRARQWLDSSREITDAERAALAGVAP